MFFPHEQAFRSRAALYWVCSFVSLWLAWRSTGLASGTFLLGLLGTAVVACIAYRYALWLQRLERRHQDAHPRKYRSTIIVCFYLTVFLAMLLPGVTPRLKLTSGASALGYFLTPVLLAGAAGIMRGAYEEDKWP